MGREKCENNVFFMLESFCRSKLLVITMEFFVLGSTMRLVFYTNFDLSFFWHNLHGKYRSVLRYI